MITSTAAGRVVVLLAALTLVASACSSGGGIRVASLTDTSVPSAVDDDGAEDGNDVNDDDAVLAFAACMREQGLDDFEDPEIGADGSITFGFRDVAQSGDIDRETIRAAMDACRNHLEGLALGPGALDRSEVEDQLYEFAACMRDNGYDMPDPDFSTTPGQGGGDGTGPFAGIDPEDADFQAAMEACDEVFGGELRLGGPGRGGRAPNG